MESRLQAVREKLPSLTVAHLMTQKPVTIRSEDDLATAAGIMARARVRHLAVVKEGGKLVGLISHRDILRHSISRWGDTQSEKILHAIAVSEAMNPSPITGTGELPLSEAARILFENQIGCLPVVKEDQLVGILTEGDFVAFFADPL